MVEKPVDPEFLTSSVGDTPEVPLKGTGVPLDQDEPLGVQTSRAAYEHLVESGELNEHQAAVCGTLFYHRNDYPKGMTAREVSHAMGHGSTKAVHSGVHSRLRELANIGMVKEAGTRKCSITGRTVISWQYTTEIELPPSKPKSLSWQQLKQQLHQMTTEAGQYKERLARLADECAALRAEVKGVRDLKEMVESTNRELVRERDKLQQANTALTKNNENLQRLNSVKEG